MPKKSSGLYVHILLSQPTTMLIPEVLHFMLPLLYQCRFIQCILIFLKSDISNYLYAFIHQHATDIVFQLAQRSAVFPLYSCKCHPHLISKQKAHFSINTCFTWKTNINWHIEEVPLPRPDAFDIQNWKCSTSAAKETSSSTTRNLHMEITVFFLFNFLFLDTWI